jgi:hypothetical protein
VSKKSNGEYPGNPVQAVLHFERIGNRKIVDIKYVVAVVGHETLSPDRIGAHLDELARHEGLRHRQHLDGEREPAQHAHELAIVDDADEPACGAGKHLLASQGTATAFDQVQSFGSFIGTVDVQVEIAHFVQGRYVEPTLFEQCRRGSGTGYDAIDTLPDAGQHVDQKINGRSGTDAENHTWLDEL